jgi:diguanylate cyclase (GGDEF)-like protein/PAS domain S-box-containing protein
MLMASLFPKTYFPEGEALHIKEKLLDNAFEQLHVSALATVVNAIVLALVLWDIMDHGNVMLWLVPMLLVTFARFMSARYYAKDKGRFSFDTWERVFLIGVTIAALTWASAAIWLFVPGNLMAQAILLIIFAGISAGAISSLAFHLKAVQIFLILMLTPLIVQLATTPTSLHAVIAFLVLLFLIMLLITAKRYFHYIYSTIYSGILFDQAKEKLELSEEHFKTIFTEVPAGVFFYDTKLQIIESNQEFAAILRAPLEHVIGLDMTTLTDHRVMPALNAVNDGLDGFYEGEYKTKLSKNDLWITLRTAPVFDASRNVIGGVGLVSDITERMAAQRKIRRQAYYDILTDIPNRAMLADRVQQAVVRYKRHNIIAAVLFLDLDHFKNINDSLGHHIGDELLKETACRLLELVREEDVVARLGGDEFVILLPDLGESQHQAITKAELIAEKVHGVFERPFIIEGHTLHTTTSIGVAVTDAENGNTDDLLKHADTAMYQAKKEGRGQTSFYQSAMDRWIKQRLQLENDLKTAIELNNLALFFQPTVEFSSKKIVGAEALLRWYHPQRGYITPEEIVTLAEECGMIVILGQWVLETACQQLKSWQKEIPDMRHFRKLAINVSTLQFKQDDYVEQVIETIRRYDIDPASIALELTESIIIDEVDTTIEKMERLRAHGIGIAIDDFGTGYSSLSYLKKLPFSALKIDRSFVKDFGVDSDDAMLIETIIAIAKRFNLMVIAEGVETYEQYVFLYEHHCQMYQGYLCSPPLPAERFTDFLISHNLGCPDLEL